MNSDENDFDECNSDDELEQSVKGTAAAIVLINIFDPESKKSWKLAHVATCQLVRHYLRTQSTQYLGVSLYGTDDDNPSIFALKSVKDIFPLSSPTLNDYNTLEKTDINTVKQSKELVLSEVLGHCSKMFSACKKTLSLRTIIMLTSLDQPPASYDQEATLDCVEDLVKSGIEIKIVNIAQNDQNCHSFYYDFLFEAYKIDDEKDLTVPKHVWAAEEIKNKMITHCDRQLSLAELPFELGADVFVGVKIYKLLKSQIAPKTSYIHRESKATVFRKRMVMKQTAKQEDKDMDQDEDEEKKTVPLISEEILYGQEYGGKKIEFTHSEYNFIKNPFGSTMLKLLGFKPISMLHKEKWFIENCYFLFPSEAKIEGSTIAFNALYHACKEMEVAAICMLLTRKNARPKVVALSPSTKPFGINADIGFDVIVLPFVENVRNLPGVEENNAIELSNDQKGEMDAMMNNIIDSAKFHYKPEMFENPVLQYKYKMIEAKALEDEEILEIMDTTKPNENIFKDLNDEKFYELFGPFGLTATKRTKATESNSGPKKAKTNDIDENVLQEDIKNKKVDKYSVEQLKQVLRNLNITGLSKKKKNELVQLVYEHYA